MFYVYVLKSKQDGLLYTGYTTDLRRRFSEHNNKLSRSTKGRAPFELIYYEAYSSQLDAKLREKRLKHSAGARTALKRRLISSMRLDHFV